MRAHPNNWNFDEPEEFKPIEPVGLKIINHPKLEQWQKQGYAKQERDGLWLHYTAVCELLKRT